jgi:GT2 family glycosyltransferase
MYKISIVILNWNGINYLRKFLGTVVKFSGFPDTVIYVADNFSDDGSQKWIAENFSDIKILSFDKNHGFAGGYNRVLQQIEADYFVLLNSDIEVTDGWLKPLVNYMDNNPDAASCQPKILSYKNRELFEYAGAAGGYIDKWGYPFCRGRIFDKTEKDLGQYDNEADIFWSSGACMIVRSEAWQKCGGFDNDFFAHMEEIDLCWRFHRAGYRVGFTPESVVYHVGGGSLPYDSPFKTFLNFRNSLYMLYKNLPDNNLHSTIIIRRLLDGLAAIMFLISGKPGSFKSVWKAHMDFNKNLDLLKAKRKTVKELGTSNPLKSILNKSLVFEFYIKGKRTFTCLITDN